MFSEKCHLPACRRLVTVLDGEVFSNAGDQFRYGLVIRPAQRLRIEKMGSVTGLADDARFGAVLNVADQGVFLVFFAFFGPVEFILDLHRETEDADLKAGVLLEVFGDHGVWI